MFYFKEKKILFVGVFLLWTLSACTMVHPGQNVGIDCEHQSSQGFCILPEEPEEPAEPLLPIQGQVSNEERGQVSEDLSLSMKLIIPESR